MRYKKLILLTIMLVTLLAVSAASAAEDVTDNIVNVEETTDDVINTDMSNKDVVSVEETDDVVNVGEVKEVVSVESNDVDDFKLINQNDSAKCEGIDSYNLDSGLSELSSLQDDELLSYKPEDILSDSLPYDILLFCDDSLILGETGHYIINLYPKDYSKTVQYYFVVNICDSYGNPKISKTYSGILDLPKSVEGTFNTGTLNTGKYTVKIVDSSYRTVYASHSLDIYYQFFSVSVKDTSINYGSNGVIPMFISPTSISPYKYNYHMKIYNSNGVEIYSKQYSGEAKGTSYQEYTIYSGSKTNPGTITTLAPGTYTIKIINNYDKRVLDTAKLTMKSETPSSSLSVSVEDTSINYNADGKITIRISPITNNYYTYDFYLKIIDSNNVVKINKRFNGEYRGSDYLYYNLDANSLSTGVYTIKIINTTNNRILDAAKLTVKDTTNYVVSIQNTKKDDWAEKDFIISISPISNNNYKYDFYLNILNSKDVLKITKHYSGNANGPISLYYTLNSYDLLPGSYTVRIIKYGSNSVLATSNLSVVISTKIVASNISTIYNSADPYLSVRLKALNEYNITGAKIYVNFNGVKSLITDENPQVKLSTKGLVPKDYYATITFEGNDIFIKSATTIKVTVKKANLKVIPTIKKYKANVKPKKYYVTVKNSKNQKLKNIKVSLTVKGRTFSAYTLKNGVATLKVTNLLKKGTYKAYVSFAGSKYYNKLSKKVYITVK